MLPHRPPRSIPLPPADGTFVAIDFETADNWPDSACAVGLVRVEAMTVVQRKSVLIRPPRSRFLFTHIHGITWEKVKEAAQFAEAWDQLAPLLDGASTLVAHNAPFDRRVLAACCSAGGLRVPDLPVLCTVQLARRRWGQKPNDLPSVCRRLGIELVHHDPGSDAEACARIVIAATSEVMAARLTLSRLASDALRSDATAKDIHDRCRLRPTTSRPDTEPTMTSGPDQPDRPPSPIGRLGPVEVLMFAAWCGLAAGELEVASRFVRRALSATDRMYLMTRHFVWLVPLVNLSLFLGFGVLCALATRRWPRLAGWTCPRLIVAWAVLPSLLLVGRGIYAEAWLILAIGIAVCLVPIVERRRAGMRRWLKWTAAPLLAAVAIQGGWIFGEDALKRRREQARPSPAADSPDVLLIVLDTVRADHLSLYGYERPTSPHLEDLARRGVRFNQARSAAPWTLASHASMFTGRWPHELDAKWMWPMRGDFRTLAEYLGSLGYATFGSVGNTFYCAYDSGLDRGFTEYRDYVLDAIAAMRTVYLVDQVLDTFAPLEPALDRLLAIGLGRVMEERSVRQLTHVDRKDAGVVNRELIDWLDRRREPGRPFFAFVNYVDAHAPYVLPAGASYRFGPGPATETDLQFLLDAWLRVDKTRLTRQGQALGRDCYDSCVAYADEHIGALLDELRGRGVLDRTIVIVTADHGEGFGEHGLFDHGESLYRTEIRVPLLISLPSGGAAGTVVEEFVSLVDIPATISDLVSPGTKSPFPGRSLAGMLHGAPSAAAAQAGGAVVLSELAAPNPSDPNHGRSPAVRGRLRSLAQGDYVYIRNEGDGKEELFNERDDPRELIDRSRAGPSSAVLQRFRESLRQTHRRGGKGEGEGRKSEPIIPPARRSRRGVVERVERGKGKGEGGGEGRGGGRGAGKGA